MSKRGPGASFGGDEERYGKAHIAENMADNGNQAQKATAAQMARRKIAQAKSAGRRSASPAVSTGPIGTPNPQFQLPTPGAGAGGFNFSFGQTNSAFGQQPQQSQQNGSPAPFQFSQSSANAFGESNTNSFAFNNNSTQPQQNSFTPSISSSFGQQQPNPSSQFGQQQPSASQFGQPQSNSSSFTFGQTQQNGTTPDAGSINVFKSFGQQNQTNGQNGTTTSFQFGAPQSQKEDPKPASLFGGFGQKAQENDGAATSGTSFAFGDSSQAIQQNGDKNIFGASTPSTSFTPSTLGASSIFSNLGQKPLTNGDKPLFPSTPSAQETSKPATGNIFGSFGPQTQTNGGASGVVQKPPSTPAFGGFGQFQANGVKATTTESRTPGVNAPGQAPGTQPKMSSFGIPPAEEQTPKPANLFSTQSQVTPFQADANMTTPEQTPQKSTSAPFVAQLKPSATPAARPPSLFDRVDRNESDKALGRTSTPPLFSTTSSEQSKDGPSKPLFTPSSKPFFNSFMQTSTPKPASQESALQASQTAPAKSLFERTQPASQPASQNATGANIFGANRNVEDARQTTTTSATEPAASPQSSTIMTAEQKKKLKGLNAGLLRHLQAADRERDWSAVFRFYQLQLVKICSGQTSESALYDQTNEAKSTDTTSITSTSSAFVQTPKPNASASAIFNKPPETAPVQKRRLFEEDDDVQVQPPATEKRVKVNEPMSYPKLPDSASNTAKLFEAALDNTKATPPTPKTGFTPSFKPLPVSSDEQSAEPAKDKPSSGFQPTGFRPISSTVAGGNDMFAAFGKAAKAQEEKDRSKRKAEDYDSDDETAEEWEKRDQEEQERKRAKIAEAAKAGMGFKFNATATAGSPSKPSSGSDTTAAETPKAQPKSLFERITPASPPKTAPSKPSIFSAQTPAQGGYSSTQAPATALHKSTFSALGQPKTDQSKSSSNIFGFLRDKENTSQLAEDVEKEQGSGDKTFKPDTPIKFGSSTMSTTPAVAPPKFTGLFGSSAPPSGISLSEAAGGKLAPPSTASVFGAKAGSLNVSRATTPGITTDGEGSTATGADDADGAEPDLPQVEDQTALQPDERKANDVLFELGEGKNALCKKYEDRQGAKEWVSKGKGRLYILKNKATGKVRIMLKIAPFGKPAMNYEPVKGIEYKVSGTGKTVSGAFFDHLHVKEPKLGQFTVQVKEADDAKEIARILNETPR